MSFTPAEETQLRALLPLLGYIGAMGINRFDGVPWIQWNGRTGDDTNFLCQAAPAGHVYTQADIDALDWPQSLVGTVSDGPARCSLDSGQSPIFRVVEYGGGAFVPGTIPIVEELRNFAVNPRHPNVVLNLKCFNGSRAVFLRCNGMDVALAVPDPHSQATAAAKVNAYAIAHLRRNLYGSEQATILAKWPGPTYTDADVDAIELYVDTLTP